MYESVIDLPFTYGCSFEHMCSSRVYLHLPNVCLRCYQHGSQPAHSTDPLGIDSPPGRTIRRHETGNGENNGVGGWGRKGARVDIGYDG